MPSLQWLPECSRLSKGRRRSSISCRGYACARLPATGSCSTPHGCRVVFHLIRRSLIERPGEIAPHDLHPVEAGREGFQVEGLAHSLHVDSADALMAFVDKRDLPEVRLLLLQTRPDPHEFGNLHGLIANVNRVSTFSQVWRTLDHGRGEPIALEPIRQGRPSNTRS